MITVFNSFNIILPLNNSLSFSRITGIIVFNSFLLFPLIDISSAYLLYFINFDSQYSSISLSKKYMTAFDIVGELGAPTLNISFLCELSFLLGFQKKI